MDYPEELGNWPTMYEYQHAVTLCVVVGLNGSRVAMYVDPDAEQKLQGQLLDAERTIFNVRGQTGSSALSSEFTQTFMKDNIERVEWHEEKSSGKYYGVWLNEVSGQEMIGVTR